MKTMEDFSWAKTRRELTGFVYRRVKDQAVAEDITQDVLIKVFTKVGQLQSTDRIGGWIYRIARNSIIDYFRSRSKSIPIHELDWDNDGPSLNACVETCLKEMLETLPAHYRQALELTEFSNLSQLELATKLNISYSGAKSRVQRARQILKERMHSTYNIKVDHYGNVVTCENLTCGCSA